MATGLIQPALSYSTGLGVLASTVVAKYAVHLFGNYLFDKEPVEDIKADDAAGRIVPPPLTSPPPRGPFPDKPINLSEFKLDIINYDVIKLKPDRSFIRAFYYIRNKEDPTEEQLRTFIDTDLIRPIGELKEENPKRVNFVMHFSGNFEKEPYINFSTIREALTKALVLDERVFTIEDLLKVANVSTIMRQFLDTTEESIDTFFETVQPILIADGNFYKKPYNDTTNYAILEKIRKKKDTTTLPLFKNLWVKMKDRESIILKIKECLKDSSESLVANGKKTSDKGGGYLQSNREYNKFIENLRNAQTSEINFSKRCGIGNVLAEDTQPKKCVTFLKADKHPYNYGCDIVNKIYKDNYIIYKYDDDTNHCVLLKPKALAESKTLADPSKSQPPTPVSILKKDKKKGKTPVAEVKAPVAEVKKEPVKVNNCDKYETELFSKGGTRKHRKKKQKRVTKRRRRSKSRRKGTKRI